MSARRGLVATAAVSVAAAILAAGCGGGAGEDAQAPAATASAAAAAPIAATPAAPGEQVRAGAATPKPVARALEGSDVVVVAFLVTNAADDESVAAALREVRGEAGVQYFVYEVGKDSFGDLADVLGVAGTPAVAVIGRDRVLANLWTGLVDAEILRQSVRDAKERAAANPGAAAESGAGSQGALTGNPAGVALAKKVNLGLSDVAGVKVTGSLALEGAGTMRIDAVTRIEDGQSTGFSGSFELAGARFEAVGSADAAHLKTSGASCWARLPGGSFAGEATPAPAIPDGARVSAPRAEGTLKLLDVRQGGVTATYAIDAATNRLAEVRAAEGTVVFETLATAPEIPSASPVCDDPTEALEGLPAALGGTS